MDNLEEVMETVSGGSQSLTLEKKPSRQTATSTITTPATPSTSVASTAAPSVTQPKKPGVADAISSAVKKVTSHMEAALKKKKPAPTATVTRDASPVQTGGSSPRISSSALFAASEESDMETQDLDDDAVDRLLLSPPPPSPRKSPQRKKKTGEPGRRSTPTGADGDS